MCRSPPTTLPSEFAISPDGRRIVFRADDPQLWVRSLDSTAASPLKGTDGGIRPFWSADSRSIGFFADGKLKRIDADGGPALALANAVSARGGAWNRDEVILFAPSFGSPLLKVSASGGEATAVTRTAPPQQSGHYAPQFLPDGRHFLYYVIGSPEASGVYVGDLTTSETRRLFGSTSAAVYASSALLFVRQGTLLAQRFDPARLELIASPVPVAEQVLGNDEHPALSAAMMGSVVFRSGSTGRRVSQFAWFDRSGHEIEKLGGPDTTFGTTPTLSPDGRRVALTRVVVSGNADTWLLDTERGSLGRFTFDPSDDINPTWSPDSKRLVFSSTRAGARDLYLKAVTGAAGSEQLLLADSKSKIPTDWSSDGRFLLYQSVDPKTGSDIWALPLVGEKKPFPVGQTDFDEQDGQFSPDGKWVAYESNKSGRPEVFLQPFPGPGGDMQVSTAGGGQVRWRRDGKELFYIAADNQLMAVPIQRASGGESVEAGTPVPLFPSSTRLYMVAPDGQRFLLYMVTQEPTALPITVVLNWGPKS